MRRFTEGGFDVGRSEGVGLRFDPSSDLHVSARHARFERRGAEWIVRDLESRNGTFVDGTRIAGECAIREGSRIRFGWEGPEVEVVRRHAMPTPDVIEGLASRNRMLAGLVAALVIIFAGAVTLSNRSRAAALQTWEIERAALAARTDSALAFNQAALAAIAGELDGLAQALRESEARVRQLQADLTAMASSERPDPESLATLRAQIDEATARMSGQRRAASLDAVGITARVRPAVVMIYTEFVDGTRSVATGFAVSSDGRVVTNRHVVAGETGRSRASRVGIQFSGSTQVWPADVMAIGEGVDLALLQTRNLVGGNPEVGVLNPRADTLGTGTPVLLIGFPDTKLSSEGATAPRAIATAGTSLGLRNGRLEVDGWGAAGGSGSPVLDGTGAVVGVLFGAAGGDGDRHLVAVPVSQLRAFLAAN